MSEKLYTGLTSLIPNDSAGAKHWIITRENQVVKRGYGTANLPSTAETIPMTGHFISQRFTDIHNHGGGGVAFEDAPTIGPALAVHRLAGTGQLVASLVTNPIKELTQTIINLHRIIKSQAAHEQTLVGIHLEGPYLSPLHKGAHNPNFLTTPTPQQAEELIDAAGGYLKQITIAPETDADLAAIEQFVSQGVAVAVGHTDADYKMAKAAFDAGASILTHTFNAMRPLLHREPGPIAAALDSPHVTLELICDGVHVHAPTIRAVWAMAPHRIALITDAMSAAGCTDGHYMLGSLDVDVVDSVARLSEGGAIAGSTLTLARAIETAVACGIPLPSAVDAATTIPAQALGLEAPSGLNLLDAQGKLIASFS